MEYKIVTALGAESPHNNTAIGQVQQFVNDDIAKGWRPLGGISVTSVVGPKASASEKDTWWLRVSQAMVRGHEG